MNTGSILSFTRVADSCKKISNIKNRKQFSQTSFFDNIVVKSMFYLYTKKESTTATSNDFFFHFYTT